MPAQGVILVRTMRDDFHYTLFAKYAKKMGHPAFRLSHTFGSQKVHGKLGRVGFTIQPTYNEAFLQARS